MLAQQLVGYPENQLKAASSSGEGDLIAARAGKGADGAGPRPLLLPYFARRLEALRGDNVRGVAELVLRATSLLGLRAVCVLAPLLCVQTARQAVSPLLVVVGWLSSDGAVAA